MRTIVLTLFLVSASQAVAPVPRFALTARARMVEIRADNQPLATYVYRDAGIHRPYFKDLHAPGGIRVSRHHPPREDLDAMDHPRFHPGLWLAFGDLSGADSWRNRDPVEHLEFVEAPWARGDRAGFKVRNQYRRQERVLCEETCTYTFLLRPSGTLILWDSVFHSDRGDFWFGDQEEMGLGIRVVTPIMVKPREQDAHLRSSGRILDARGRRNESGIWGKQALWCDYSGSLEGRFAGITIMPDPDNVRPCWWHTRDYGFMAANPFGRAAFKAGPTSNITVRKGECFSLSYGILLHAHEDEAALDLTAAYEDYLKQGQEGGAR